MPRKKKCTCCGEGGPLTVRSDCHPADGTKIIYHHKAKTRWLEVVCSKCGRPVTTFELDGPQ